MTAGELLVKLGFEVDTLKLNEFIKDLGELNLSSIIAAAGLKEMVAGLTSIMTTADKTASSLNSLSTITGVQQQVFQQWDKAAQSFNVSAGVTSSTIADIQKHIANIPTGDPWAIRLAQLFNIKDIQGKGNNPQEVLNEVLKKMEGMDTLSRRRLLSMAGINEELIKMVGHEDEVFKEAHNTNEQFQEMGKFHRAINELSQNWVVFMTALGGALAPILTPLVQILNNMLEFIINLENHTPRWVSDLAAGAAVLGTMLGFARGLGAVFSGLAAVKWLGPLLGDAAMIASKLNPVLAIASTAAVGGAIAWDLLKPKDNGGGSTVDNSGDVTQHNTYNIETNDPNSMAQQLDEYNKARHRDASAQNPQVSW